MLKELFSDKEINTGRQTEWDFIKGISMILIFIVHAFQATSSDESPFVAGMFISASVTGAAIFIFVLGFGAAYSSHSQPRDMVKSGVMLVMYQYLSNVVYVASLSLPYLFIAGSLSDESRESFNGYIMIYLQFINIFFISGIIYLVLALCRKLNFNRGRGRCQGIVDRSAGSRRGSFPQRETGRCSGARIYRGTACR